MSPLAARFTSLWTSEDEGPQEGAWGPSRQRINGIWDS